jgi:hypothetical protein
MDGLIVFTIVGLTAAYLGKMVYQRFKAAGEGEGGCSNCSRTSDGACSSCLSKKPINK